MIEGVPIEVLGGGLVTAAAVVGVAYRYATKGGTVEADIDGDGESDVTLSSPKESTSTDPGTLSDEEVDEELKSIEEIEKEIEEENKSIAEDMKQQAEPAPKELDGMALTDITGVGPTKAQALSEAGLESPKAIWYSSDNALENVDGIGPHLRRTIRDDIGGIDYSGGE